MDGTSTSIEAVLSRSRLAGDFIPAAPAVRLGVNRVDAGLQARQPALGWRFKAGLVRTYDDSKLS